jgi:hypothetical protein
MLAVSVTAPAATINGIVSFSSNLSFFTTPPPSLKSGAVESNTTAYGLVEATGVTLSSPFLVDAVVNGAKNYNSALDLSLLGTLPAGMMVNSYLVHFDPVGSSISLTNRTPGVISIEFESWERIAGIQLLTTTLDLSSNSAVMSSGVTYENNVLKLNGLELGIALKPDWVHVVDDQHIEINMNSVSTGGILDEVRILVATPEPGPFFLLSGGLGLLFWRRRRMA